MFDFDFKDVCFVILVTNIIFTVLCIKDFIK